MADSRLQEQLKALQFVNAVEAMTPAGNILRDEAKLIVPVDTGHLKASIRVEELPPADNGVMVVAGAGEDWPKTGPVGYAAIVEYGNSNPNYPIQPYMRPAIDGNMGAMLSAVYDNIQEQIKNMIK